MNEFELSSPAGDLPHCPVCRSSELSSGWDVDGYAIWRCRRCATDFVHPAPDEHALKAYYDRAEWFEGGERGGYASYDSQTEASPPWLIELLDELGEQRADPAILDIGCAYGTHLELARTKGWRCYGVEPSAHARAIAAERHPDLPIREKLSEIPPVRVDLILLLDVIEHLADPYTLFFQLFSSGMIGPETVVIISTPNARSRSALRDGAGWVYRHPPSHLTFYSGESFHHLLKRLRFRDVDILGHSPNDGGVRQQMFADEVVGRNADLEPFEGLRVRATGSDFAAFMHERYVPGTFSSLTAYEHMPRYAFVQERVRGLRVLDFGCGSGYGSARLAETAADVTAVDISQEALNFAQASFPHRNIHYSQRDDLGDGLADSSFDAVVCFEVIEHITQADQKRIVGNFARVLKPDGRLYISTPNPKVTALYSENPFHLHEMDRDEFRGLLQQSFANVRHLEQRIHPAIIFRPEQEKSESRLHLATIANEAAAEPAVFLAVASAAYLPPLAAEIHLDVGADYIQDTVSAIHARGREINGMRHIAELERKLAKSDEGLLQAEQAAVRMDEDLVGFPILASNLRHWLEFTTTRPPSAEVAGGQLTEDAPHPGEAAAHDEALPSADTALAPQQSRDADKILTSGFFDSSAYAEKAGLGSVSPLDSAVDYLLRGERLGLPPSARFDPQFYAEQYPDVSGSGLGLLTHYLDFGRSEGRLARPAPAS